MVTRERLFDALDRGSLGPLTLVTAPAGAGKSVLLGSWLAARPSTAAHVAWLSVDQADARPAQFWEAVIEAATAAGEPALRSLLACLDLDRAGFQARLAERVAMLATPLVLILDDFHELRVPGVCDQLDALLRHPPPMLRLVIASRADPPLSLPRLRLTGDMTELRAADLAFTRQEAMALMDVAQVMLTDDQLCALHARTEGWAAGLRLAALSLRAGDDEDRGDLVGAFAGDEHRVADYLVEEVLHPQPAAIRDFMLRTSVVDSLSAELANALTGRSDAARVLDRLERSNAFVSRVGEDRSEYRYHRMFGELLRSQLGQQMPDLLARQHRVAARWYAKAGELTRAARHALAAGDCAFAGDLLATSWPGLVLHGESGVGSELIARLPRALVRADPELSLAAASVQLECGEPALAGEHLERARATSALVKPKRRAAFQAARALADLYDAESRGDYARVLAGAERLLSGEGAAELEIDARERRALVLLHKGVAETWLGHEPEARADLDDALALAGHAGLEYLTFGASGTLAVLEALTGGFAAAADLARVATGLAARRGWSGRAPATAAWCALAVAAYHRNANAEAERALASARTTPAATIGPGLRLLVAITDTRLALRRRDLQRADAAMAATRDAVRGWPVPARLSVDVAAVNAEAHLAAGRLVDARRAIESARVLGRWSELELMSARVALSTGDARDAVATIRSTLQDGVAMTRPSTAIEARALGAVAEHRCGHDDAALELIEDALELAEPQQDLAPFLAVGPSARELLMRRIRAGTAHRALAGELGELLDPVVARPVDQRSALALESLSEREEVVLRYLPTTLSKAEIASEMLVSVNTVKTHMKNIYRKLDVTDRAQAVRRARTLHLV
ncbi:MAG TPA: LuxR C-terminal-related transcriptional regulator [Solirubrobacteraceae bacterium]|nr:LuxR C-terminal-related transcriptional regulator [Solirubrobacteraceae bacterium]